MQSSSISWTQKSSNPIRALDEETGKIGWMCSKITDGCTHCYSEATNFRYGNKLEFNIINAKKVKWILKEKEFEEWFKLKEPHKVFLCDMTDIFHEDIPEEFRDKIFGAMARAKWHTYQILTKRAEKMRDYFAKRYPQGVPSWIWFGVSVENKKVLGRIDILREIPVRISGAYNERAMRFLSCEPLLESLGELNLYGIDWIITGAESGNGRRTYNENWAREIRDQCKARDVAFFYKQGSHRFSGRFDTLDGKEYKEFPSSN